MIRFDTDAFLRQFLYDPANPLLFNNGFFVFFLAAFIMAYHAVRGNRALRTYVFCLFSLYFFYKASGSFVLLVVLSAIVNHLLSLRIHRADGRGAKNALLAAGISFNLAILFYFKYTDFFISLLNSTTGAAFNPLNILLPIGISFYTFENISYMTDVRRGAFTPVERFSEYLLFLSFFPKLVMGPIVRAQDFIPQIARPWKTDAADFDRGFRLILGGLFKKLVISDFLTLNLVDNVFDDPARYSAIENLMAVYAYALVIYCDFSGYSDVAIGLAKWLGFDIPANFQTPYRSTSLTEFWRRWHISLSSWLRDYLYIPIGGNRKTTVSTLLFPAAFVIGAYFFGSGTLLLGTTGSLLLCTGVLAVILLPAAVGGRMDGRSLSTNLNLTATMLLGGLWHGASWNFILWGGLHGLGLSLHKAWMQLTQGKAPRWLDGRLWTWAAPLLTFHFVCLGWVFFKAADMETALLMLQTIGSGVSLEVSLAFLQGYGSVTAMMALGFLLHLLPESLTERLPRFGRALPLWAYVAIAVLFVCLYGYLKSGVSVMPIYLQF